MLNKSFLKTLFEKGEEYLSQKWQSIPEDERSEILSQVIEKLNSNRNFAELVSENRKKAFSYFYRSLKNRSINYLRDQKLPLPLSAFAKTTSKDPLYYVILVESEAASYVIVDEVLSDSSISEALYFAYLLSYRGLTLERLSWMFDIPKSTLDYRVKRAGKKLAQMLKNRGFLYDFQLKIFVGILVERIRYEEVEGRWQGWRVA